VSDRVTTVLEVLGLAAVSVGVGLHDIGAGLAVAGAGLLAVGIFGARA